MKMKVKILFAVIISFSVAFNADAQNDKRLLVVAGGHRFDTLTFFSLFKKIQGYQIDTVMQPSANELIASGVANKYNAIVFYDSWKTITEDEKVGYYKLLMSGVGIVFMHHALVSYQDWPQFIDIIGGKYQKERFKGDTTNLSDFKHDIWMRVKVSQDHPITVGLNDFDIFDEGYMNFAILPTVTPILNTVNEHSDPVIGWSHFVMKSRVVYLMPGHNKSGLTNIDYQRIIFNAINWVSEGK
jgi:uncharacterized protein